MKTSVAICILTWYNLRWLTDYSVPSKLLLISKQHAIFKNTFADLKATGPGTIGNYILTTGQILTELHLKRFRHSPGSSGIIPIYQGLWCYKQKPWDKFINWYNYTLFRCLQTNWFLKMFRNVYIYKHNDFQFAGLLECSETRNLHWITLQWYCHCKHTDFKKIIISSYSLKMAGEKIFLEFPWSVFEVPFSLPLY